MRRHWSVLILFVLLGFGVSLAVPAEDVPETAYDESEALPYEGTPLFSIVLNGGAAGGCPDNSGAAEFFTPQNPALHPCLPLPLSATPTPIDPPMHEPRDRVHDVL